MTVDQILKNQHAIMNTINHIMVNTCSKDSGDFQRQLIECHEETREILNPEESQSLKNKTEKALGDAKRGNQE